MHMKLHVACIFLYIFCCIFCCIFSILAGLHILHILTYVAYIFIFICILFCIFCIYMINMHMQIDLDNLKCLSPGLHCLLQLLLGPPSQGPAVHVPPSTTITTVRRFITESTRKVSRFSSHGEGYCPGRAHWNQRKASQYGGHWNHIQDLCLFTALVDDCRLTLIHPG